jgi:predicted flap endonuclease-1-like 5' DNA nuclease
MNTIPLSGYAICFGPLALVILGFIAFAALTDANARRSYLRRVDMRPDGERPAYPGMAVSGQLVAETPSGLAVTITPEAPVARPAAAVSTGPDDLKRVEGIGPKMESILNAAGIMTFAQLAAKSADELRAILTEGGARAINDPTTWSQQAALAARGDWSALELLQDQLKGGRR